MKKITTYATEPVVKPIPASEAERPAIEALALITPTGDGEWHIAIWEAEGEERLTLPENAPCSVAATHDGAVIVWKNRHSSDAWILAGGPDSPRVAAPSSSRYLAAQALASIGLPPSVADVALTPAPAPHRPGILETLKGLYAGAASSARLARELGVDDDDAEN